MPHAEVTRCFMHVPKSGGTSVYVALVRAFPEGSVSEKRFDAWAFAEGAGDYAQLPEPIRRHIAFTPEDLRELADARIVSGHFCLATLERLASPSSIATLLRAPRRRLLSLHSFWRVGAQSEYVWPQYFRHALRTLEEFLAEPAIAVATDNAVCRMLLDAGGSIPRGEFIAHEDIPQVASAAIERLDPLGFVGILESRDAFWGPLSEFFGVTLEPVQANVGTALGADTPDLADLTPAAIELLDRRTAADRIVYDHAVARAGLTPAGSTARPR